MFKNTLKTFALLAGLAVAALLGAACGSESVTGGTVQASEPAQAPAGPNARTIDYKCARSSGNTIDVEFQNLNELANLVNGINVCEFDGGLDEITVTVSCPQGKRMITVLTLEGKVTDQAVIDACDQSK